jgi:hypothetical protein
MITFRDDIVDRGASFRFVSVQMQPGAFWAETSGSRSVSDVGAAPPVLPPRAVTEAVLRSASAASFTTLEADAAQTLLTLALSPHVKASAHYAQLIVGRLSVPPQPASPPTSPLLRHAHEIVVCWAAQEGVDVSVRSLGVLPMQSLWKEFKPKEGMSRRVVSCALHALVACGFDASGPRHLAWAIENAPATAHAFLDLPPACGVTQLAMLATADGAVAVPSALLSTAVHTAAAARRAFINLAGQIGDAEILVLSSISHGTNGCAGRRAMARPSQDA